MADFTTQITSYYQAVQFRAPPAAELAIYNAALDSGTLTQAQVQQAIEDSSFTQTISNVVIREYQAAFGRVPDRAGLDFWVDAMAANPGALATLGQTFANSAEFTLRYGANASTPSNEALVAALYVNVFGRAPDAAGLAFWSTQKLTADKLLEAFAQSAEFKANTAGAIDAYEDAAIAGNVATSGSLFQYGGTQNPGQTFTLTANVDAAGAIAPALNTTGTAGNDTYNAVNGSINTLTSADQINGGAGTDTLNLLLDASGSVASLAGVTNVEVFNLRDLADGTTVDFAGVAGETQTWNDRSTGPITLTNVGTGTTVGVRGDGTTSVGATNFTYATGTDAINIAIDGGVKGAANITRAQTGAAAVAINSTGAANTVGVIDLDNAGATIKAVTINATAALTAKLDAADYAANSTLTVAGAGKVDLSGAALSANLTTVNASANTGGTSVLLGAAAAKFTGGSGADTVNLGGLVVTGTIDGDGGIDTVIVQDQAQVVTATASKITGFETLRVNDDDDGALDVFNASLITGITGLAIGAQSAADGVSFTNVSAALAANVTIAGSQAVGPTFAVTGAATVGQLDTLTLNIDDGLTAKSTLTVDNITAAGVETVNLVTNDHLTLSAATGLTSLTKLVVSGAGDASITTGALALNVNTVVDASALTGAFTFSGATATANGLAITGSATAANTITGTAQSDTIVGGTGIDNVTNTAGTDTLNFASDTAVDTFSIADLTGRTTITNFDAATTTTTEDLVNVMADTVDGGEIVFTAAAGQVALTTDRTYVVEQAVGAGGSLTTGGTATLATADFTAGTLTNVAAYLSERFTTVANDAALVFVNNGTNSYAYSISEGAADAGIQASEVTLVGVFNGSILQNGDIFQTV